MPFEVAESTLESLEWGRLVEALRTACRTPQGRLRLAEPASHELFCEDDAALRARLRETTEARRLLDHDAIVPLAGCADLEAGLAHAERGGILEPAQLVDVRRTLDAIGATLRFFEQQTERAPALSARAMRIETMGDLHAAIDRCLDARGEVCDAASTSLADARRDANRLSADLKQRIERTLQHADVLPHLSDRFYTVRGGRYVLPVRADAKGQVRGIVHDASRSGTTLFVEPEGMIELNNRHRQAELTIEREILRILRDLSGAVATHTATLRANLETMAEIDLACARGRHSQRVDGIEPEIAREGVFELPGLRHPLIPADQCVANDLRIGADFSVLILSGPNAGGKTVALKAIALAALMVRAGLHVAAGPGARVDLVDRVLADIGDHQDIQESLSTFSAAMANLAAILRQAGPDTLVCLDEIGVGTDPSEGAAIAQASLEVLAESGARVVTTTHYNLLKEMAEVEERFENASVEFDAQTLAPTYRVRIGSPGASSASTVAARMGMPRRVLDRATGLLAREDRRLDRMLAELGASRALLESEQVATRALRAESERVREEYRAKLSRLHERRDKLFGEMRGELDDAFRTAHSEVSRIVAELQRAPSSRRAAAARERLEALAERTEQAQSELHPPDATRRETHEALPVDWPRARVGDAVRTPGGGVGRLLSLPDRRGRVGVQVADVKLTIDRERLSPARPEELDDPNRVGTRSVERPPPPARLGGCVEADLRGLRVEEALDRLELALDLAAAEGRDEVRVIHGIGTGALRSAVREHLPRSPHIVEWIEAARDEGGAGATRGILKKE